MAIDDPLDQALSQIENEQRQRSPVGKLARAAAPFTACFADAIKALESGNLTDAVKAFSSGVKAVSELQGDSNSEYLLSLVIPEVQKLSEKVEQLEDRHLRYLDTDWLSLLVDADRKARATRGRDKIRRIAAILCNAAELGPIQAASEIEEMMRIATALNDRDVLVLREIVEVQGSMVPRNTQRLSHYGAYQAFPRTLGALRARGFVEGEIDSICAKLESFGLISRSERNVNIIANDPVPYALLQKGIDFTNYIGSECPEV